MKRKTKDRKSEGIKFDSDKIRLDLFPSEAITDIAKVLTFGCKKYGTSNWAKGIVFSRLIAACKRHINTWESCEEDNDPETKINHIAHAACNLVFLIWMMKNRPDLDDRWQLQFKQGKK